MSTVNVRSELISFGEYETWFQVHGELRSGLTPLVVLHGGPGFSHDYLRNIADVALSGRAVVLYDQIGTGRSTNLPDMPSDFWTIELFIAQLQGLLRYLEIEDDFHLLGQSWGGMLAAEFAVQQPSGLRSLVLSNSLSSAENWGREAARLISELPQEQRQVIEEHHAAQTYDDPAFLEAMNFYLARHGCRVTPTPEELQISGSYFEKNPSVYQTMWGPAEFFPTGTLKNWTILDRAHFIEVPTFIMSGRYDEATPATMEPLMKRIAQVSWEIFEESSHVPFIEERDLYMVKLNEFLASCD